MLLPANIVSALIATLLYVVFIIICRFVLYPALFSPLRRIPTAHPLAPWTSLWILRRRLTHRGNNTFLEAHRQLGPVVRFGPNEVGINSLEGLRAIYTGNFDRHPFFLNVGTFDGVPNMLSSLDAKSHNQSRRLTSRVYSKSYIQESGDLNVMFNELVSDRIRPEIRKAVSHDRPIELLSFGDAVGYDFINAFLFGLDNESDMIRNHAARRQYFDKYAQFRDHLLIIGELQKFISLMSKIGINVIPFSLLAGSSEFMSDQLYRLCAAARKSTGPSKAIVHDEAVDRYDKIETPWPKDIKIAAELSDQTMAAFETTSITLAYLVYELSQNTKLQSQLRDEIRTLDDCPTLRDLDSLPLLDALIQETLRRYPASPFPQPRVVPKEGIDLCGYRIPGGVRVSSSAYVLHRNEKVFPDPEQWKPSRWLESSEEQLKEMRRWFWAFGSGARMCLGIHFAIQELKFITAAIYRDYETSVFDHGDMTPIDGFIARPVGNRLNIKFRDIE